MNKKHLYQTPKLEVIEIYAEQAILAGSIDPNPNDPTDDPFIPDTDTDW